MEVNVHRLLLRRNRRIFLITRSRELPIRVTKLLLFPIETAASEHALVQTKRVVNDKRPL